MFWTDHSLDDVSWLAGGGAQADLVISTRVRLARNLAGRRFPHHAEPSELLAILDEISACLMTRASFAGGWDLNLADHEPLQRKCLQEMHLASPVLVRQPEGRGLIVSPAMDRAVMVNEEDHLRLQVFRSGFEPKEACDAALELDHELEQELDLAYSTDLGYLTACPTNVGTGFRISVLIHLPALVLAGEIEKILNSLRQLQFVVRGLYGEGSAVRGALFQISNLTTLGRSEQTLTRDFARHVSKVIQYERMARDHLRRRDPIGVEDMVQRSLAVLSNARLLTTQEVVERLSHVRVGVALGILPPISLAVLNRILILHRSAHLQLWSGRTAAGKERSRLRAQRVRELLAQNIQA